MYYSSVCKKETFTYTIFLEDTMQILQTTDLKKYYGSGDTMVRALDGVNLSVENHASGGNERDAGECAVCHHAVRISDHLQHFLYLSQQ